MNGLRVAVFLCFVDAAIDIGERTNECKQALFSCGAYFAKRVVSFGLGRVVISMEAVASVLAVFFSFYSRTDVFFSLLYSCSIIASSQNVYLL